MATFLACTWLSATSPAAVVDKNAVETSLKNTVRENQPLLLDRDFSWCRDRLLDGSPTLKEWREAGEPSTTVVIGELTEPNRKPGASFVGAYSASGKTFQYLAISESPQFEIRVEKLTASDPPFLIVGPIDCKAREERQTLAVFRRDRATQSYQKVASIPLHVNVEADGSEGLTRFTDTGVYAITGAPDRRELSVTTTRTQSEGKKEFTQQTEVYAWNEGSLVVIESTRDGKLIFGRADPMPEIARLQGRTDEVAWKRLLDLTDYPNAEVAHTSSRAFFEHTMKKLRDPNGRLSRAIVDYAVTKYVEAPKKRGPVALLIQKTFSYGFEDPTLTPDEIQKLEGTLAKNPNLDVLVLLAAAGDVKVWIPLVNVLRDSLANDGCNAVSACHGLLLLADKVQPTPDDIKLIVATQQSKLFCEEATVQTICL